MNVLTDLWITLGRIRRKQGRRKGAPTRHVVRDEWIRAMAPGRSFADVGGLFNISGDIALLAESCGATSVSLFDAGNQNYTDFPEKAAAANSQIRFVRGDLEDPEAVRRLGPHDIVYCAGVLYHTPNPLLQLMHLREITSEFMYLSSHTIAEVPGVPQACIFYPYLDESTRTSILRAHGNVQKGLGIGLPFDDRPMHGHGNFWWGMTPSALRSMLRAARFEIIEERLTLDFPFLMEIVARPIDKAPLLPPATFYREQSERVDAGGEDVDFDRFYENTGRGYI